MPEAIPDVTVPVVRETDTVLAFIELTFFGRRQWMNAWTKEQEKTGDNICESYA